MKNLLSRHHVEADPVPRYQLAIRVVWILAAISTLALAPWWLFVAVVAGGVAYFDRSYEAVLLGFAADAAYGSAVWAGPVMPFMLGALAWIGTVWFLRTRLR